MKRLSDRLAPTSKSVGNLNTPEFVRVMEDHLSYIKYHQSTVITSIPPEVAGAHEGDFNSILLHFDIAPRLHRVTTRINGLLNPSDFRKENMILYIPDGTTVAKLFSIHKTSS